MEFSFELWIHGGLLGPYYLYIVKFTNALMQPCSFLLNLCTPF